MAERGRDYDRVELVWPGKRTEVERVRLPFQVIERVNDVRGPEGAQARLLTSESQLPPWWPDGWHNKLIWGDNKYVLSSLLDEFAGKVDLIYIDPPFDTGDDFGIDVPIGESEIHKEASAVEMRAYRDMWGSAGEEIPSFLHSLSARLMLLWETLSPGGNLYVHLDYRLVHYVKVLMDELFGRNNFQNEIIWAYRTRQFSRQRWNRKHHTVLYYSKGTPRTFNVDSVLNEYSDVTVKKYKYEDENGRYRLVGRGITGSPIRSAKDVDPIWERTRPELVVRDYLRTGYPPEDWWVIDIENQASLVRTPFPTQKPEALLQKIILASSNPGDIVMDAFCGSGTTAAVAEKLGRRWIGTDLGRFAIQTTRKRLLDIPGCRPFEVLNLGRYERRYWQGVNAGEAIWEYYRLILDLYRAQPISGFTQLHGQKAGRMVHVGATDAPVTFDEMERTLEECAANGLTAVDVLGWEWEMGLNPAGKDDLARKHGVDVHLFNIPREVMDKRAVEAGDVHFFELSVIAGEIDVDGHEAAVILNDFMPAVDEYMRQKVGDKATKWSDWIDYWSVDFEYDGQTYINQWQSYRTRKDPKLALRSDPHIYEQPGTYRVVVKVIDIFGNDTTEQLEVTID